MYTTQLYCLPFTHLSYKRDIMKTAILILAAASGSTVAFTTQHSTPALTITSRQSIPFTALNMGGAQGYATTLDGKKSRVETVKSLLDTSDIVFSIPAESLTVAQVQQLRRAVPEGSTISVIKNKLMARAVEGTPYQEGVAGLLKGSNMWFFVEEDFGGTVKAFNAFTKSNDKKESHTILGGVVEGEFYDAKGIVQVSKLPSKIELYTQIAAAINAVPTRLARVIKEPGNKLARAIKLAGEAGDAE